MTDSRTLDVQRSTSTAHRLVNYDGVCGNIHGHNMKWDVRVEVDMSDTGDNNMPLDLKAVADIIDEVDHAIVLSSDDPLAEIEDIEELLGDVIWFDGDPTCEVLSQWMADRIANANESVLWVSVDVAETDKYSVSTDAARQSLKLE